MNAFDADTFKKPSPNVISPIYLFLYFYFALGLHPWLFWLLDWQHVECEPRNNIGFQRPRVLSPDELGDGTIGQYTMELRTRAANCQFQELCNKTLFCQRSDVKLVYNINDACLDTVTNSVPNMEQCISNLWTFTKRWLFFWVILPCTNCGNGRTSIINTRFAIDTNNVYFMCCNIELTFTHSPYSWILHNGTTTRQPHRDNIIKNQPSHAWAAISRGCP